MSIKLGYDLKIEQSQKLVMTPELIQAIQILKFNTQELDSYVQEQLLVNPVLEQASGDAGSGQDSGESGSRDDSFTETVSAGRDSASSRKDDDFDWKEYIKDRQYDDISYRQWEDRNGEEKENTYEQYVFSDVTLPEHLVFQLQCATEKKGCRRVGEYIIESLDENGISQAWVLPVLPHVGFEEILAASKLDNRIIPFTCIDFSLGNDAGAELLKDSEKGAMGLKIHPILQRKSMLSDEVHEALKAWEITKKPVICHTYPFAYFHPEESFRNIPEFGSNYDFLKLADKFPSINFVAAHSGGTSEYEQLYEGRGMKNVYVDTSFQSAAVVKEFIRRFGEDRVLFGSDWPWGKQNAPVKVVEKACDGDKELEAKVFYKNAERLIVKTEREEK